MEGEKAKVPSSTKTAIIFVGVVYGFYGAAGYWFYSKGAELLAKLILPHVPGFEK